MGMVVGLVKATHEGKKEKNTRTNRIESIETKGDGELSRVFEHVLWPLISLSQSPHVAVTHNQYYLQK